MSTITDFSEAVKDGLRKRSNDFCYTEGTDTQGFGAYCDLEELDIAIDELTEEFRKRAK